MADRPASLNSAGWLGSKANPKAKLEISRVILKLEKKDRKRKRKDRQCGLALSILVNSRINQGERDVTIARSKLVDVAVSRGYHCPSRCVRRAFLFSEVEDSNSGDRKGWIERRLKELAEIFAVSVGGFSDSLREGMLIGFILGNYLMLVEYTGRLLREGKASISSEFVGIFERLGSSAALWQARLQRLGGGRGIGRFLSTSRERLRIGSGAILLMSCVSSVCILLQARRVNTWRSLQFGISLLLLLGLLVVYPPFWSHTAYLASREREVADKRTYILNSMSAELVRDDARRLLSKMTDDAIDNVLPSAPIVPEAIRALDPLYILARGECLQVVLGKGTDSYDLLIYADGANGRGTKRLCKGLWFFQPGKTRWITDSDWDEGARQ